MKIFDLKMKIEECNLKKLEEEAEEAKEEESALEAAGAASVEGDGVAAGGVAAGGETAQESENIANLTNEMANEMNMIIADILKEKVEKVGALILNKLGAGSGEEEDGVNLDEGMEFDTMVEKDNYLKTPDNMTRSAGITPEVNQGVFRLK